MNVYSIEFVIDLIQQLRCNGITLEELAYGFGVCSRTIRNYENGLIPANKIVRFTRYIKQNYQEIYEHVRRQN